MAGINNLPSWLYLFGFVLLSIGLRVLSFSFSVIDHDEATYLVIAQELLKGKAFYTDVWDTKPIGIFYIFVGFIQVFGHSVVAVRLFAAIVVGLTAWALFLAARRWGQPASAAAIAGLAYPLMCSLHKWTLPANTEIFFNLFTAVGLYFFLGKRQPLNFFLTGLAFGLGFLIKYFVLFDLAALWLFYALVWQKDLFNNSLPALAKQTAAMGLGFVLPFAAVFSYYYFIGPFADFWFNTFQLPWKYAGGFEAWRALNFLLEFHLIYLPFVLAFYALVFWGKDRQFAYLGGLWVALVWMATLLTGKFFLHYYFQLLPPLCFALTALPGSGTRMEQLVVRYRAGLLLPLVAGLLSWNVYLQYQSFVLQPDVQKEVFEYLKPRIKKDDVLYCNQSNILYFLLEKNPLSRYVHPTLMTKPEHVKAAGVDVQAELQNIVRHKPKFMVLQDPVLPLLQAYTAEHCRLLKIFGNSIRVYESK